MLVEIVSELLGPKIVDGLDALPQLTLDIQFNSDSAIVRPESYKLLGRVADALYHPYLQDRKFLVVAHIEAAGKRQNNLDLSQKRASAIREGTSASTVSTTHTCCERPRCTGSAVDVIAPSRTAR